jgi:hypothetical protein
MNYNDPNLLVAQMRIEFCCLTHEIVKRTGRFGAGKSAARDNKREPLTAHRCIFLQRRFFQKRHHAISQQRRIRQILHGHLPIADAGVVEEICLGTERQQQMIELELKLGAVKPMRASDLSRAQIDIFHLGFDHVDVAQNPPLRIHNVGRREIARRDLMQHRRK